VRKTVCVLTLALSLAFISGCNTSSTNSNTNPVAETTTQPGPDNSEVTTKVDASGVKTQERVFKGNPRISRVVVTTKDGTRTVKAYSSKGEESTIKSETEDVLVATGDKVADAAGFVGDKAEDVAGEAKDVAKETADKAEDVAGKTVDTAKKVGEKTASGAKEVGSATASGAKKVGSATASGAKKAGSAVKKVIP
jgi:hypothetical protein